MKKVLVIGYVYPEPNSSAAGIHILSIMRRFKKEHWEVTFSTPAQTSEHAIDLASEGINSHPIVLNCDSFDQYISKLQPDIVLFDRFMEVNKFVEASVSLYIKEDKWEQAKKNAIELLHAQYNGEKLGNKLIEKVINIEENLEEHRLNNFTGAMLKHHSLQSTKYMSQWIELKSKLRV